MSSRYNWQEIDPKYQWAATDGNGARWAFAEKPVFDDDEWFICFDNNNPDYLFLGRGVAVEDVQSTLEQRPVNNRQADPCPFCGGETDFDRLQPGFVPVLVVICMACGARGPKATTAQEAIVKWNGRQR